MSGLLFLGTDDFRILKGTKGPILCNLIEGFSLILFYSKQCPHCQELIPIFKKLPGSIGGCQFGMLNVSQNKDVIRMATQTIAPIEYVPYIILYVHGKPFMRYQGPPDINEIRRFVFEIAQNVNSKQQFSSEKIKEDVKNPKSGIPAYTIGHPLYGDENVTYLKMDEAYPDGASGKYTFDNKK